MVARATDPLDVLVRLARHRVPGCDGAVLCVLREGSPATVVPSDALAARLTRYRRTRRPWPVNAPERRRGLANLLCDVVLAACPPGMGDLVMAPPAEPSPAGRPHFVPEQLPGHVPDHLPGDVPGFA